MVILVMGCVRVAMRISTVLIMSRANPLRWKIGKEREKWNDPVVEPLLWSIPARIAKMQLQTMPTCIPNYQSLDMPRGTDITDSTGKYGIKRATSDTLSVFGIDAIVCVDDPDLITCKNVELIFNMLQDDLQDICEMYYFQKMKPAAIIEVLGISERTFYYKLQEMREFFKSIA
jgi:hypothetical protein